MSDRIDRLRKDTPRGVRRHRADVTADRLLNDYESYLHLLDRSEQSAFERVIRSLREIAEIRNA